MIEGALRGWPLAGGCGKWDGVRRVVWLLVGVVAVLGLVRPARAEPGVELVAGLPLGSAAYGLAVGPDGLLYVGDVGGRRGEILVFGLDGGRQDRIAVAAGPSGLVALRGMAFDRDGSLYVADLADGQPERGRIVKVNARGRQSVFASGLTAPTALAIDRAGVVYVANALEGSVDWIGPDGASATFVEDERLRPSVRGGVGASGLAFAADESALYIANFSANRILKLAINPDGSAGRLSVLVDAVELRGAGLVDGPLGLAVDSQGNILVAVHRSDEIQVFSPRGRLLGRLPTNGGSLFSNPTALATSGRYLYVANLGLEQGLSHVSRVPLTDLYQ